MKLSRLQKEIMSAVKARGYTTTFDTLHLTISFNLDYRDGMKSAYASASRSLRRLVQKGLLVKVRSKFVGDSDVFVLPDCAYVPRIERRSNETEAYKFDVGACMERLNSKLTDAVPQADAEKGEAA